MILLALLVAGLMIPRASATPRACANPIPAETYTVTAEARRDVYRLGQMVEVDVFVTDSITGLPAEDVQAAIWLEGRKDKWLAASGPTDERGHVLLTGRLKRSDFEPGWAHAFAAAWESFMTPLLCADRYGWEEYPKLFRITR